MPVFSLKYLIQNFKVHCLKYWITEAQNTTLDLNHYLETLNQRFMGLIISLTYLTVRSGCYIWIKTYYFKNRDEITKYLINILKNNVINEQLSSVINYISNSLIQIIITNFSGPLKPIHYVFNQSFASIVGTFSNSFSYFWFSGRISISLF